MTSLGKVNQRAWFRDKDVLLAFIVVSKGPSSVTGHCNRSEKRHGREKDALQ